MKKLYTLIFIFFFLKLSSQSVFDQKTTVAAANDFLSSLTPAQKAVANLGFIDSSRTRWSNLPMEQVSRHGIRLDSLTDEQRVKVHALLRTVLSPQGYEKAIFIMQYDEDIKTRLTASNSPIKHRYGQEKYWTTIFEQPDETKTWGWKFEGHHISFNFTHTPNGVTCTPMFTGINPALTTVGITSGRYIMEQENELGKKLFASLTPQLQQKAIIGTHPLTADVMVQKGDEVFLKEPKGVSFKEMNKTQQEMVVNIIKAWVENLTPNLAVEKMNKALKNKDQLLFAWLGTTDVNQLHYYRIYTPTFIIEITNRDGGIQHLHSMWRDLTEDFKAR